MADEHPTEEEFEERKQRLIRSISEALEQRFPNPIGVAIVYLTYDGMVFLEAYGIPTEHIKPVMDAGVKQAENTPWNISEDDGNVNGSLN